MGRRLLLIGIAGFALAACGSKKSGDGEAGSEPATAAGAAVPEQDPPEGDPEEAKAAPGKADGRRIAGTAVTAADGGPAAEGRIDLVIDEAGRTARGTLDFDGRSLALEGVFDDGHLRLWAAAGAGDAGAVRRGYVLGRSDDSGALEGDFALSDSGAAWSVRGTWKSDR